ncbi:MAG: 2OG-Fe(II) oxygenase [Gammaproteobacteria bacterium]|nr:2OG-Fe(II) oxygenase [Gammaproteobacteria bacterium]NIQ25327.1 2OG-Fe(II) oxygenase [Gammaproteobacteria bacterium]
MPDVLLPESGGAKVSLYDKSRGKPLIVLLCTDPGRLEAAIAALGTWCGESAEALAHGFVISPCDDDSARAVAASTGFPGWFMRETDGQASRAFGFQWQALDACCLIFVLDPNQRILEVLGASADEALEAIERVRARLASLELFGAAARPRDVAPILMIPRVLEPELCKRLIEVFHARGNEESGVHTIVEGVLQHQVDHSMKKRFDHYVRDDDIISALNWRMARRVVPEIHKAFYYEATKCEEFKIVCYRADEQGYFRVHRDNYSPQTVHRRFAMTLNLNEDEYEGGELRFPEYGPHLYKPRAGEAVIFSCSLLHEAMNVTRGERYALIAFLYGEDGARQRREMDRLMRDAEQGP